MRWWVLAGICFSWFGFGTMSYAQTINEKDYVPSKQDQTPFEDKLFFPKKPESPKPIQPPPTELEQQEVGLKPAHWSGGLEFGLNGSEGNSEILKIRLGSDIRRESQNNLFVADVVYGLANQMGVRTEHKALFNARDEILFVDTPWSIFSSTNVEYDQFRAFDFRVGVYGGVGYQWIKSDTMQFRTRLGAGAVREYGGPRDRWVPEALIGYDFSYRFTDRQQFVSTLDFYPNIERGTQFRIRSRAAYEILVDPSLNLTLRLGIQNRYDSDPGPAKRNDVDYFATLLFRY